MKFKCRNGKDRLMSHSLRCLIFFIPPVRGREAKKRLSRFPIYSYRPAGINVGRRVTISGGCLWGVSIGLYLLDSGEETHKFFLPQALKPLKMLDWIGMFSVEPLGWHLSSIEHRFGSRLEMAVEKNVEIRRYKSETKYKSTVGLGSPWLS